jgi:hypothetical protein
MDWFPLFKFVDLVCVSSLESGSEHRRNRIVGKLDIDKGTLFVVGTDAEVAGLTETIDKDKAPIWVLVVGMGTDAAPVLVLVGVKKIGRCIDDPVGLIGDSSVESLD